MATEDLSVQLTRNGRGIVAKQDFASDEVLFQVTGPFVTCDEDDEMNDVARSNTFRYDADLYISPEGTIGDFQNHSCEPNAKVVKVGDKLFVVAIDQIRMGEEVLIDYSTIIAADDIWEMQCLCGSRMCRGVIGSFDRLPAALRKTYIQSGIVPEYIIQISQ